MAFINCYMLFFKRTIRKAIDRHIEQIKEHKNDRSNYAIWELEVLKRKLGLED